MCSVAQSWLTFWDPMDCSLPGSSIHGIFQARILELLPFPMQGIFPTQGLKPDLMFPSLARGFFYHYATWEAPTKKNESIQNLLKRNAFVRVLYMPIPRYLQEIPHQLYKKPGGSWVLQNQHLWKVRDFV